MLVVCPYTPYPVTDGGKSRVYNLIMRLSKEHTISLICFSKNREDASGIRELKKYCRKVVHIKRRPSWSPLNLMISLFSRYPFVAAVNGFSRELTRSVLDEIDTGEYDAVQVEHFYAAQPVLRALKKTHMRPVKILDEHNVEFKVYERMLNASNNLILKALLAFDAWKMKKYETGIWKKFDVSFFCSNADARYCRETRKLVVPNGADVSYFRSYRGSPRPSVVFLGNFRYAANVDAMRYFTRRIWPQVRKGFPGITLDIVGYDPHGRARKFVGENIRIRGFVRDARAYLNPSNVFIAPLRIGSGTKLKVLDAMASGMAIVGTSVAFEGLDVRNGKQVMISDGPENFAGNVLRLLKSRSLRKKLGIHARILAGKRYNWDEIAEKLSGFYAKLGG